MKHIVLTLTLTIVMLFSQAQAVLEHVYGNKTVYMPVKLANLGWVYPVFSNSSPPTNVVEIYSNTHILLNTIPVYLPSGYSFWSLDNVSDVLFNSDSKIEILYDVFNYYPDSAEMILMNEAGVVLQTFPHQTLSYYGIYNIEGAYKLKTLGDGYDTNTRIYSLPGTMVDVPTQSPEPSISAFPNPCNEYIDIVHSMNATQIRVLSVEGKELFTKQPGISNFTRVRTADLPTGTYIYEVIDRDGKKLTGKFIKQ